MHSVKTFGCLWIKLLELSFEVRGVFPRLRSNFAEDKALNHTFLALNSTLARVGLFVSDLIVADVTPLVRDLIILNYELMFISETLKSVSFCEEGVSENLIQIEETVTLIGFVARNRVPFFEHASLNTLHCNNHELIIVANLEDLRVVITVERSENWVGNLLTRNDFAM